MNQSDVDSFAETDGAILDLTAIRRAAIRSEPFRWAAIPWIVPRAGMMRLADEYPRDGLETAVRESGGDKTYRMEVRPLVKRGDELPALERLSPRWQAFVRELNGPAYTEAMVEVAGPVIRASRVDIGVFRYGSSHGISPHTDHAGKVANHIIYFNPEWRREYGGLLCILGSRDAGDLRHEVMPTIEQSAVIVRSDSSWHMVSEGSEAMVEPRMSLQVEFWVDA